MTKLRAFEIGRDYGKAVSDVERLFKEGAGEGYEVAKIKADILENRFNDALESLIEWGDDGEDDSEDEEDEEEDTE